jgi:hypothetical protein
MSVPQLDDVLFYDEKTERLDLVRAFDPAVHLRVVKGPIDVTRTTVKVVADTLAYQNALTNVASGLTSSLGGLYCKNEGEAVFEHETLLKEVDITLPRVLVVMKKMQSETSCVDDASTPTPAHGPAAPETTSPPLATVPPLNLEVKGRGILLDSSVAFVVKTILDTQLNELGLDGNWLLSSAQTGEPVCYHHTPTGKEVFQIGSRIDLMHKILDALRTRSGCDLREILRSEGTDRFPNLFLRSASGNYVDNKHFRNDTAPDELHSTKKQPSRGSSAKRQKTAVSEPPQLMEVPTWGETAGDGEA